MPCYLFTYHGYATWLPDRARGYVHRTQGLQPQDDYLAQVYRHHQREPRVTFDSSMQPLLLEALQVAVKHLGITAHAIAIEPSHVHVLVSWTHDRQCKSVRASLRSAMSRALNQAYQKRTWFADTPSRKQVKEQSHFNHLVETYLPKHQGTVWVAPRKK